MKQIGIVNINVNVNMLRNLLGGQFSLVDLTYF